MPATYVIDCDRQIVFSTMSGCVTDEEVLGHQDRLRANRLFQRHFRQLVDTRAVDKVEVTLGAVRRGVKGNPFGPTAKRALVTDRPLIYGLTRMFGILLYLKDHDNAPANVFYDMAEARQWLGLD
jgi:hypothetical protein